MERKGPDRRKYTRIGTDQVICFAPVEATGSLGLSTDVSPGGIRFQAVGCEIEMGEVIRVTFNLGEQTVEAVGRVVWSTEVDPITLDVGLEFVEIDPFALQLLEEEAREALPE